MQNNSNATRPVGNNRVMHGTHPVFGLLQVLFQVNCEVMPRNQRYDWRLEWPQIPSMFGWEVDSALAFDLRPICMRCQLCVEAVHVALKAFSTLLTVSRWRSPRGTYTHIYAFFTAYDVVSCSHRSHTEETRCRTEDNPSGIVDEDRFDGLVAQKSSYPYQKDNWLQEIAKHSPPVDPRALPHV